MERPTGAGQAFSMNLVREAEGAQGSVLKELIKPRSRLGMEVELSVVLPSMSKAQKKSKLTSSSLHQCVECNINE